MELSTVKILEEKLLQYAIHQTLGEELIFQQDNNLQHEAKSTLQLLTKKTGNVPECPSFRFDLNLREYLWQDLKIAVQPCFPTQ